jgi:hypothetical protein
MTALYEALYAAISWHRTPQPVSGAGAVFGPAQAQRNDRLRGFTEIMPPETRECVMKVAVTSKKVFKLALTTSSRLRPRAADPASELVLRHLDAVRGSVLVLGEPKLGEVARASSQRIDKCVVWDLNPRNLQASLLADPLEKGSLGSGEYDCELVVGKAWQRSDCRLVIANLWQALRPGGSLLFAVPAAGTDRDGFTEAELRVLVEACSPAARAEIVSMKGDLANDHHAIASREPGEWLAGIVERASEETA